MKKQLIFFILLMFFVKIDAFAAPALKQPQGRLGTSYKTEKYNPVFKTNITPTGLANLNFSLTEEKNTKPVFAKERVKKQKFVQESKKQEISQQNKLQTDLTTEQAEKQKLVNEQIKTENNLKQLSVINKVKNKFARNQVKDDNEIGKTPQEKLNFFKKLTAKEIKAETNVPIQEQDYQQEKVQTSNITEPSNQHQDPLTREIVNEIQTEISNERTQMLEELSLLWVNAVQKSDTVYFAIMKLSNPNGEEVNKSGVKKILQPILSAAPLVGQAFVNPALSAGSLIGSNVMGTMMNDSANRRLTKVNDADLVILARSIDELQETLLINYLAYKSALKEYELSIKITDSRKATYDKLNSENSPNVILANTFYTEALDNQYKARQEFLMKRVVLEQMVGADALNEMEKKSVSLAK